MSIASFVRTAAVRPIGFLPAVLTAATVTAALCVVPIAHAGSGRDVSGGDPASHANHANHASHPGKLVERPDCDDHHRPRPTEPAPSGGLRQVVEVTIPATAMVRVDGRGRVVAVSTNTGCAPRVGNAVYLVHPDGSITPAPRDFLKRRTWVGNFTRPGTYAKQS